MTSEDIDPDEMGSGDEFWGSTPDWSDTTRRPRRERSAGRDDVTGVIKGLWNAAMSGGVAGTRQHRVFDATAPRPGPADSTIDSTMFDDLDNEIPMSASGRVDLVDAFDHETFEPTTEVPVIDAAVEAPAFADEFEAVRPLPMLERDDSRTAARRAIDPLLVRVGAVAVVTTLLVPLMIGLTSGGDDGDTIASATTPTSPTLVDGATNAPGTASSATVVLDPDQLPPDVPVNSSTSDDADDTTTSADIDTSSASSSTTDEASGPFAASDVATVTSGTAAAPPVETPASAEDDAERINNCAIDYDVQVGDFWLRLAEGAGVPLAEILEANGATTNTPLYPGVTICLPAGSSTPPPPTTAATTTAAPSTTSTTTTTTTVAPTPMGPEDVQQVIRDVWPDELEERALEIAYRESRYDPTAKNFCCYGLFQIYWNVHKSWLGDIGITNDQQLFDPATNARAAYALYQRAGGWGPWGF